MASVSAMGSPAVPVTGSRMSWIMVVLLDGGYHCSSDGPESN
jgi:hypothetical protein